jgi:hypothetical protein
VFIFGSECKAYIVIPCPIWHFDCFLKALRVLGHGWCRRQCAEVGGVLPFVICLCAPYPRARPIFPALKLACQRARNLNSKLRFIVFCDLPLRPPHAKIDLQLHISAVFFTPHSNGAHHRPGRQRAQEHGPQARAAHCRARGQVIWSWRGLVVGTGERQDDSDGATRSW